MSLTYRNCRRRKPNWRSSGFGRECRALLVHNGPVPFAPLTGQSLTTTKFKQISPKMNSCLQFYVMHFLINGVATLTIP